MLLSLLHVGLGVLFPNAPGWKMFARIERIEYRMVDPTGQPVRLPELAPLPHYVTNAGPLIEAAVWLARRREAPVGLSVRGTQSLHWVVDPSGSSSACAPNDPRPLCRSLSAAWDEEPEP